MNKRFLSILLAIVMVFTMIPLTAFATESEYVYISVSYDDKFKEDKNGAPMAYVPVSFEELASVDLDAYGLSDYWYDENGDGTYETTALQLIIYAHEELYGGDFSEVSFTGGPGSSYFEGGLFGQACRLQILGFFGLHNHVNKFLVLCMYWLYFSEEY